MNTYISLFSSAGIGCYGFQENGFKCIATNEFLDKRLKIQKNNNKCEFDSGYILGDLSLKETQEKIYQELENNNIDDLDVLIATPPCQGMSVANHKKKDEKKRNSLVVESIKMVKKTKPKFFIFENVRAFLNSICTDTDNHDKNIGASIRKNLGGDYNIDSKVINFKDYGSHSSRTRTLVIGVRKDLLNITPLELFPKKQKAKTLRELIGNLPSLKTMGEISEDDIYHSFRSYDKRMLPWIEKIVEGQSAFDNIDSQRVPHRIIDDKIVFNKNKNGDKYARWYWDKEGPCIHTRNDILASQNTIHPSDNRVFSIRELMRMMSIPESFKWSKHSSSELNLLPLEKKKKFLRENELNIRHCIGEAVPTEVFKSIASNIKKALKNKILSVSEVNRIINKEKLDENNTLKQFIKENPRELRTSSLYQLAEISNSKRKETKAYYTRADIAFNVVSKLPDLKKKKKIRILEPSVGIGSFLPFIFSKYSTIQEVILDIVDIDKNSLEILGLLLEKTKIPKNFTVNIINEDFLLWNNTYDYDVVVGNPPFGKLTGNKELLEAYKVGKANQDTNNIFAFFIEKVLKMADYVSLIVPKSLISSPEFNKTRDLLSASNLISISDYGEKAFKGVKIETISFLLSTKASEMSKTIEVESYITNEILLKEKSYIFSDEFPYWLIYRNSFFDYVASKMNLDIYESFRDRQITKKVTSDKGKVRVLKSRNIGNNSINDIENYDCYMDDIETFAVSKYLDENNIVLVPNLTYNPRATFLPKNCIADGSVALLKPKSDTKITEEHLAYYSTKEFVEYYKIARNRGTRSLNIDTNSVKFFGLLRNVDI